MYKSRDLCISNSHIPRWLVEYLRCPICLETYQDPQMLMCSHTLCGTCTEKLTQGYFLRCPQCRQLTNARSLKRNLGIQQLVDACRSASGNKSYGRCGLCEEEHQARWFCDQCLRILCTSCKKAHVITTSCRSEHSRDIGAYVNTKRVALKRLKEHVEETARVLQAEMETRVQDCSDASRDALAVLHETHAQILQEVDEHFIHQIAQVSNCSRKLEESITAHFNEPILKLENCASMLTSLDDAPANTFVEACDALANDVEGTLKATSISIKHQEQVRVHTSCQRCFLAETAPKAIVNHNPYTDPSSFSRRYAKLLSPLCINTDGRVYDMVVIAGDIWCLLASKIKVFSSSGTLVKEIGEEIMEEARGLVLLKDNSLLIATLSSGLLQLGLTTQESEWRQVEHSGYSDICTNDTGRIAYALRSGEDNFIVIDSFVRQKGTMLLAHTIHTSIAPSQGQSFKIAFLSHLSCFLICSSSPEGTVQNAVTFSGYDVPSGVELQKASFVKSDFEDVLITADSEKVCIQVANQRKTVVVKYKPKGGTLSAAAYDSARQRLYLACKASVSAGHVSEDAEGSKSHSGQIPQSSWPASEQFTRKNTVETSDTFIEDIALIGDSIWCLFEFSMQEFDARTLEPSSVVDDDHIQFGRSLASALEMYILVACRVTGLIMYDSYGCFQKRLEKGNYFGVTCYGNKVFTLSGYGTRFCVQQFTCCSTGVRKTHEIRPDIILTDFNHLTCGASDAGIFLADYNRDVLYCLDNSGRTVGNFGVKGCKRPGQLVGPRIAGCVNRNVLLVDENNERLQVLDSSSGKWSLVNTVGLTRPRRALADEDMDSLYVTCGPKNQRLMLFSAQNDNDSARHDKLRNVHGLLLFMLFLIVMALFCFKSVLEL